MVLPYGYDKQVALQSLVSLLLLFGIGGPLVWFVLIFFPAGFMGLTAVVGGLPPLLYLVPAFLLFLLGMIWAFTTETAIVYATVLVAIFTVFVTGATTVGTASVLGDCASMGGCSTGEVFLLAFTVFLYVVVLLSALGVGVIVLVYLRGQMKLQEAVVTNYPTLKSTLEEADLAYR